MKKNNFFLPIGLFLVCLNFTYALDLKEAFELSLKNTETNAIYESLHKESQSREGLSKAKFWPLISMQVGRNYQQLPATAPLRRRVGTSSRINLAQSIYSGGRDWMQLKSSEAQVEAAHEQVNAMKNWIFAQVAQAFYGLLNAQREVENIETVIKVAEERIEELDSRMKIGKSKKADFISSQAQLTLLKAELIKAQGELNKSNNIFYSIVGVEGKGLQVSPLPKNLSNLENVDFYLKHLDERPDIKTLKSLFRSSLFTIDSTKGMYWPELSMSGNYYPYYSGNQPGINIRPEWDISLNVTWPLFVGGTVGQSLAEAREKSNQVELNLAQRRRVSESEIRNAHQNFKTSLEQMNSYEKAWTFVKQNYSEQEKNYRLGVSNNLEVMEALKILYETKRLLDQNHYACMIAWAELQVATSQVQL